jgi:hypothetical protein
MKQVSIKQIQHAGKIILTEMEILQKFHGNEESFLVPASVGAKVLGISLQAMEERMSSKTGSFRIIDSFGKKYLIGMELKRHFEEKIGTLINNHESLSKYEKMAAQKIVDYAIKLETKQEKYPPS